jgi:two-component system NtrC family sensor kinase
MVRNQGLVAIDDDPIILKLLDIVATQLGFDYYSAPSGEECLAILEDVIPSILVLDIEMPGLDGFETYEEIKKSRPGGTYPIIFLSAKSDAASIARAGNLGNAYYLKPIRIDRMVEKITATLQLQGAPVTV